MEIGDKMTLYLFVEYDGDATYNPYNETYWGNIFNYDLNYYNKNEAYFSGKSIVMNIYGHIIKDSSGHISLDSTIGEIQIEREGNGPTREVDIRDISITLKALLNSHSFYDLLSARDSLEVGGGYGNEIIHGTNNADLMQMGEGTDKAHGLGGDDRIEGYYGDDKLWGGQGSDEISGDENNDQIIGGRGADTLYGGSGSDEFIYTDIADSRVGYSKVGYANFDTIGDFENGSDTINLSTIDANINKDGNQKFTFVDKPGSAFDGKAGELIWGPTSAHGSKEFAIMLDVDGDKKADFYLDIHSKNAIAASDFIL
jgi:Ca2+-binding RTX toxin-like protein